ncbi:hypothetical protein KC851_04000 [Candidatus Kaiserbacteria bacterium]|nr:hypothetical protein [Candidatus Kaiserbacteria bacterium]
MEPITYTASVTASTSIPIPAVGFDIFAILGTMFGVNDLSNVSSGLLGFLESLWSIYVVLAFLFSIFLLVIYVFASIRRNLYIQLMTQELRDQEALWEERAGGKRNDNRLAGVIAHSNSDNPNDWKLAIIEADVMLDEALKNRGFVGTTLGERLRNITPNQMDSINDAWEAHKVRNRIAHEGSDFILTQRVVQETIMRYQRVFTELGIS